jgi:hypothetical protein
VGETVTHPSNVRTAAAAPTWFHGVAGSGTVGLRLHAASGVHVDLGRGWRSAVGPHLLGAAVLEARGTASVERLRSWADARVAAAAHTTGTRPAPTLEELRRARRDLREFGAQLAAVPPCRVVSGPRQEVAVVVRGGQVVDVRLDPAWCRAATDTDLEHRLADALGAALRQCAAVPGQALDGCPDLAALLADHPGGAPFGMPDPRGDR